MSHAEATAAPPEIWSPRLGGDQVHPPQSLGTMPSPLQQQPSAAAFLGGRVMTSDLMYLRGLCLVTEKFHLDCHHRSTLSLCP